MSRILKITNTTSFRFYEWVIILFVISFMPVAIVQIGDICNPNNFLNDFKFEVKHFAKIIFSHFLISCFFCSPLIFLKGNIRLIWASFMAFLYLIPSLIDIGHIALFGTEFNTSSWIAIISAPWREAVEFINDYSGINLAVYLFAYMACLFVVIKSISLLNKKEKSNYLKYTTLLVLFFSVIVLIIHPDFFYPQSHSLIRTCYSYDEYRRELQSLDQINFDDFSKTVKGNDINSNETHVLIIGESTSSHHMSLFGYPRITNPELEKIKARLLIFNQAKTSWAHTAEAITSALVFKDSSGLNSSFSLIDLLNAAGYETYWISNQELIGKRQSFVTAIAKRAKHLKFINGGSGYTYDENILPELKKIINLPEKKKVIFIHLAGTHLSYQKRYPARFNVFKEKGISIYGDYASDIINQYDNAVLYNDQVVSIIMNEVWNLKGVTSATYFSDHGDEVYDFRNFHGHSQTVKSKFMTDVPLLIQLKGYQQYMKDSVLKYNHDLFKMDDFPLLIQDILGVSSCFKSKWHHQLENLKTNFITPDSIKADSSYFTLLNHKALIWAHRVNSSERFHALNNSFNGFEMDVVYEGGELIVRHPPAESTGLKLSDIILDTSAAGKSFWIDLKNLDENNCKAALLRLNTYCKGQRGNFIIETTKASMISAIKSAGFICSYYIPDLVTLTDDSLAKSLALLKSDLHIYHPDAISQSVQNIELMDQYFPLMPKLTWALNGYWQSYEYRKPVLKLLEQHPSIRICLVNQPSVGWR